MLHAAAAAAAADAGGEGAKGRWWGERVSAMRGGQAAEEVERMRTQRQQQQPQQTEQQMQEQGQEATLYESCLSEYGAAGMLLTGAGYFGVLRAARRLPRTGRLLWLATSGVGYVTTLLWTDKVQVDVLAGPAERHDANLEKHVAWGAFRLLLGTGIGAACLMGGPVVLQMTNMAMAGSLGVHTAALLAPPSEMRDAALAGGALTGLMVGASSLPHALVRSAPVTGPALFQSMSMVNATLAALLVAVWSISNARQLARMDSNLNAQLHEAQAAAMQLMVDNHDDGSNGGHDGEGDQNDNKRFAEFRKCGAPLPVFPRIAHPVDAVMEPHWRFLSVLGASLGGDANEFWRVVQFLEAGDVASREDEHVQAGMDLLAAAGATPHVAATPLRGLEPGGTLSVLAAAATADDSSSSAPSSATGAAIAIADTQTAMVISRDVGCTETPAEMAESQAAQVPELSSALSLHNNDDDLDVDSLLSSNNADAELIKRLHAGSGAFVNSSPEHHHRARRRGTNGPFDHV